MTARQEIARLLEEWLQLTEAEGRAIQSAAWKALREIQLAKTSLQTDLAAAGEKWRKENPGRPFPAGEDHPFAVELRRLISLQSRNSDLLNAQLRRARTRQELLNDARRNLDKVRRCYASRSGGRFDRYS